MFSMPRFIGGLVAAALSAIVAMPPADAANSVGYTDSLCQAFFADPLSPAPNQVLKCAKLVCGISTNVSYVQPVGNAIQLTVNCTNPPPVLTYQWVVSPQSPAACQQLLPASTNTQSISISSSVAQTCWFEAVATDGATPPNNGWARYGLKWQ